MSADGAVGEVCVFGCVGAVVFFSKPAAVSGFGFYFFVDFSCADAF